MELSSVYIKSAIESLLNAHASANMYRANNHPDFIESVPDNLENAMKSIKAAMSDANSHIEKHNTKEQSK